MSDQVQDDVAVIGELVRSAGLAVDAERTVQWCLAPLPSLCQQFTETYESRFAEEIIRKEQGLLSRLAEAEKAAPAVRQTTEAVHERLQNLNERLGLPRIDPVPNTPTVKRPRRKKVA
jgi:hypothetical protein